MAEANQGSLDWLDQLDKLTALRGKDSSISHADMANALKVHRPYVSQLLALQPIFDPITAAKVRKAAPGYILSFNSAKELFGLKSKVEDFTKTAREVVEKILTDQLQTAQIKDLVDKIIANNPKRKPEVDSSMGFFERNGRRIGGAIGRVLDILLWLRPKQTTEQPDIEEEGNEAEKAVNPKSGGRTSPTKKTGGPLKWVGKQIGKIATSFLDHPGTFMKNLVIGTIQFVIWGILFCVLLGVLHWGWAHYGRAFFEENVKGLIPNFSAKVDNVQPVNTPTPSAAPATQKGTAPITLHSIAYKEIQQPEELNDRVRKDKEYGTDFAKHLYSLSYQNQDFWEEFFESQLSREYSDEFYKTYYSAERRKEYKDQREYQVFVPDNPPKLTRFDDYTDDILVEGELTLRTDLNPDYPHKVLSRERVGLILTVNYSGGDSFVSAIKEVAPEPIH